MKQSYYGCGLHELSLVEVYYVIFNANYCFSK